MDLSQNSGKLLPTEDPSPSRSLPSVLADSQTLGKASMMTELQIEERPIGLYGLDNLEGSDERLARVLSANAIIQGSKDVSGEFSMTHPVSQARSFALFGAMLGALGPLSIEIALFSGNGTPTADDLLFPFLFSLANITTSIVGYFTGNVVGNIVAATHEFRVLSAIPLLLLIGMVWGGVSGFAGGLFLLLIGSVAGAVIGAIFGGIATVLFSIPYRYLQIAGYIENRHFVPLALGTTLILCAFVLGL